jgi:hypothetical protein
VPPGEFKQIKWAELSEQEYQEKLALCNPFQARDAQRIRQGVKPVVAVNTGLVVAKPPVPELVRIPESMAKNFYGPATIQEYSWEYWLNYFWTEVYGLPIREEIYRQLRNPDGSFKKAADLPEFEKKAILERLFHAGFQEFAVNEKYSADELVNYLRAMQTDGISKLQKQGVAVFLRGDGRDPKKIKEDGGTKPATAIVDRRIWTSIDSDWHPFKDMTRSRKLFFRKYNADNCLFSVVSVTFNFETASKFPLLAELKPKDIAKAWVRCMDSAVAPVPVAAPDVARELGGRQFDFSQTLAQARARFQPQTLKETELEASRVKIYVIRAVGAYNTMKKQKESSFPEFAADSISWLDHLAVLDVVRIHYPGGLGEGHFAVVNGFRYLQERDVITHILGGASIFEKLDRYLNDLLARSMPGAEPGGVECMPDGRTAPLKIVRVSRMDPTLTETRKFMTEPLF